MPDPEIIDRLAAVAPAYDVVLCDIWGVIHNGRESFPAGCEALAAFRRDGGVVVLISNAARPAGDVIDQMRALGVPDAAWSGVVTSGDVTRDELARRAPGPALRIGPARDATLYEGLGLAFADGPQDAAFVSCTGLVDDEAETPEDYRSVLAVAADRGLEMVCANPDIRVHRGERLIWCAGALAALHRELGGRTVMAGKPHAPIYARALWEAERLAGRPVDRARVLAVGDGLLTDAAGANAQGLDLLFVAAGLDGAELAPGGVLRPDRLAAFLREAGAHARYALPHLA